MVKAIAVISFIIVLLSLPTVSSSFSSSQKSNERRVHRYASSSTEETSQMTLPLSGKTAFITGSSGGIGKAIASRFAKAGADVYFYVVRTTKYSLFRVSSHPHLLQHPWFFNRLEIKYLVEATTFLTCLDVMMIVWEVMVDHVDKRTLPFIFP